MPASCFIYSVERVVDHYTLYSQMGPTVEVLSDLRKAFDKMNHYELYVKLGNKFLINNSSVLVHDRCKCMVEM